MGVCSQPTIFIQRVYIFNPLLLCSMLVIYVHNQLKEVHDIVPWSQTLTLKTNRLDFEIWLQHLRVARLVANEPLNLI